MPRNPNSENPTGLNHTTVGEFFTEDQLREFPPAKFSSNVESEAAGDMFPFNSWLVQRIQSPLPNGGARRLRPHAPLEGTKWEEIADFCTLDYMGAAEFEGTTIPAVLADLASAGDEGELATASMVVLPHVYQNSGIAAQHNPEVPPPGFFPSSPFRFDLTYQRGIMVPPTRPKRLYVIAPKESIQPAVDRINSIVADQFDMKCEPLCWLGLDPIHKDDATYRGWFELDHGFMFFTDHGMFQSFAQLLGATNDCDHADLPAEPQFENLRGSKTEISDFMVARSMTGEPKGLLHWWWTLKDRAQIANMNIEDTPGWPDNPDWDFYPQGVPKRDLGSWDSTEGLMSRFNTYGTKPRGRNIQKFEATKRKVLERGATKAHQVCCTVCGYSAIKSANGLRKHYDMLHPGILKSPSPVYGSSDPFPLPKVD